MVVALISAAGHGIRMGLKEKKQFIKVKNIPIISHTLRVFDKSIVVDSIIILVPPDCVGYCKSLFIKSGDFGKVMAVVGGGEVRQASVRCGLNYLKGKMRNNDLVVVHDGVRPLVSNLLIEQCVKTAQVCGSCVAAIPVKDTIKKFNHNNMVVQTFDRTQLWAVQTPQVFPFKRLLSAHEDAEKRGITATDDATLVELLGCPVKVVMGDYENIKITEVCDLLFFEAVLDSRRGSYC